jgi:hypothetical protein
MRFRYEGFDGKTSAVKRGFIDSDCQENASSKLRDEYGIILQNIEPDSDQPMKTVLPGTVPFEEMKAAPVAPGPGSPTPTAVASSDWQGYLRAELLAISEVAKYVRGLEGASGNALATAAIEGALRDSIASAITRAINTRVSGH